MILGIHTDVFRPYGAYGLSPTETSAAVQGLSPSDRAKYEQMVAAGQQDSAASFLQQAFSDALALKARAQEAEARVQQQIADARARTQGLRDQLQSDAQAAAGAWVPIVGVAAAVSAVLLGATFWFTRKKGK